MGNLLLLLPLGVYAPMRRPLLRSALAVGVLAAGLSALIELAQLGIASVYGFPVRVADVDDILLNTAGCLLGYAGWRLWRAGSLESEADAVRHAPDR